MMGKMLGVPYLISLASAGGAGGVDVTLDFRPPVNEEWLLHWAYCHHDDGTNRDMRWYRYDGSTSAWLPSSGAVALNIQHPFYTPSFQGPIWLTRDVYVRAVVLAATAAKKIYIWGEVERVRGVAT